MSETPLINNHFLLRVNAIYDLPCRKISGIRDEKEYESIRSGGVNDFVYLREKQISKPKTFKVERYVGVDFFDPLIVGTEFVIPIVLYISRYIDDFNAPKQTFTFWGCTVLEKEYSELNAEQSGLLVETTTIAYQQMQLLTDVLEGELQSDWSFDASGRRYQGTGKRRAAYDRDEVRKKEMEQQSRIWPETRSARTFADFNR
jgi:hypothetical protein